MSTPSNTSARSALVASSAGARARKEQASTTTSATARAGALGPTIGATRSAAATRKVADTELVWALDLKFLSNQTSLPSAIRALLRDDVDALDTWLGFPPDGTVKARKERLLALAKGPHWNWLQLAYMCYMWADVVDSVEELKREMHSTCQASSATSYEAIAEHPDHLLLSQLPDLAQLGLRSLLWENPRGWDPESGSPPHRHENIPRKRVVSLRLRQRHGSHRARAY